MMMTDQIVLVRPANAGKVFVLLRGELDLVLLCGDSIVSVVFAAAPGGDDVRRDIA